jgi:hypothetical protein
MGSGDGVTPRLTGSPHAVNVLMATASLDKPINFSSPSGRAASGAVLYLDGDERLRCFAHGDDAISERHAETDRAFGKFDGVDANLRGVHGFFLQ